MTKILNCGSLFLIIIILGLFIFTGCNNPEQKLITEQESGNEDTTFLFTLLSAEESGISFYNELKENPKLNILTYEYLYNGSGVAIGDINNDNLPDIYLGGNLFGGRLFLNLGNMKFKQISDSSGTYVNGYSTGVCMIDINSDGLQDIYVCRSLSNNPELRTNVLFINNGDLTFTEKAAEYGINDRSFSNHANFFDYDNDGDLDMYLLNHRVDFKDALTLKKTKYKWGVEVPFIDTNYRYVSDRLYENTGNNKFKDITKKAGLLNKAYGLSVVCSDINQDGWIDIYVANDYADKDYLYINNGDGTFTDKVDDYLFHMSENSMGCDISDFNNDGLPDMITLDMMSGDNYRQKQLKGNSPYDQYHMAVDYGLSHQVMRNTLQLNNGNGTFSEIGQLAGVSHTDWSWAPIFADFDNDGYKDLFISNGYYRDVTDMDYIKYESNEIIQEAGGITKVNQLDLVNQMKITPVSNHIFQNNGDLTFSNKKNSWMNLPPSSSNGASFGDLDLDGDIDIIVNNLNSQAFIYENNASDNENNYLNIVLKGGKGNESGIGTKIYLSSKLGTQYIEATPYKGYLGSHHNIIHFGLGKDTLVDAKVIWLNGYSQELENIPVNKLLVVNQANADLLNVNFQKNIGLLESVDQNLLNEYVHVEDGFIDFKREPLLEHKISNKGPYISVADVNKDGNDDLFIGGSAGYPGKLYLQNSTGELILVNIDAFESDKKYEDCQSLFFDADNDNDLDLFITSGGYAFPSLSELYQNRLYLNNGKGDFTRSVSAIPNNYFNSTSVDSNDIDGDGDIDLFIGGNATPWAYPYCENSVILINENGIFNDELISLPSNSKLGMINYSKFIDLNGDGAKELVIAGEWMPISILSKAGSTYIDITEQFGLGESSGWWNTIEFADFDNDGDMDFVAGNRGENKFFKADNERPAVIYANDFDKNNSIDAIPFYYFDDNISHPKHTLDEVFEQYPKIRKKFNKYSLYSSATITDILSDEEIEDALVLKANTFSSSIFINENNKFTMTPLSKMAQISEVHGIKSIDINNDENIDLLITGNNYDTDVTTGRSDASIGLVLVGDGEGDFSPINSTKSGFEVVGDARGIVTLTLSDKIIILVSINKGEPKGFYLRKK